MPVFLKPVTGGTPTLHIFQLLISHTWINWSTR